MAREERRRPGARLRALVAYFTPWPVGGTAVFPREAAKALSLLPLLALVGGGVLWGLAWALRPGLFRVSALVLTGADLLLWGAYRLETILAAAEGRERMAARGLPLGRRTPALAAGIAWLLLLYTVTVFLLRAGATVRLLQAQVLAGWLLCWAVRTWPGPWQRDFSARGFLVATGWTLAVLVPGASPALLAALATACLTAAVYGASRVRRRGSLREADYGAIAGWGQVLFLWGWLLADRLL